MLSEWAKYVSATVQSSQPAAVAVAAATEAASHSICVIAITRLSSPAHHPLNNNNESFRRYLLQGDHIYISSSFYHLWIAITSLFAETATSRGIYDLFLGQHTVSHPQLLNLSSFDRLQAMRDSSVSLPLPRPTPLSVHLNHWDVPWDQHKGREDCNRGSKGISTQLHCTAHFDLSATTRIELVELMGSTNTKHLYYARVTGHYWSRATMTPIFSANEPTKPISAAFCESLFEEFSENAYTVFRQQSWSSVLVLVVCM